MSESARAELKELLVELHDSVEERYRLAEYPADLEVQLSRSFDRVAAGLGKSETRFVGLLRDLDEAARFDPLRIPTVSSLPLGPQLHQVIAKVTRRQVTGVLLQMETYARATRELLVELIDTLSVESAGQLSARVDALLEELAAAGRQIDSRPSEDLDATAVVYNPWFSQLQFMERFRGSYDEILRRYRPLAERFRGLGPVIDIGSGRGEMLELLQELEVEAVGVDLDADMVGMARTRGLRVEVGNGVAYLRAQDEASVGGIFAGQLIEHLSPQGLLDFLALASTRLRPGGRLIAETINPQSLWVFAHSYFIDPTHVRPVHPEYAVFLAQQAGFAQAEVEYRSPVHDTARMDMLADGSELAPEIRALLNSNFQRLNDLLFAPQDYALIATR
jgi:SAM-dependent methyltransferase